MDEKIIEEKFKNHLLKTVGKKPSKQDMQDIDKKIHLAYGEIYDKPDKEEAITKEIYDKKLSKLWIKVVANENLAPEVMLFSEYTKVKPNFNIASFASGLSVYELFLAKEIVPLGKVSCIDISDEMNKIARKFAKKLKLAFPKLDFISSRESLKTLSTVYNKVDSSLFFMILYASLKISTHFLSLERPVLLAITIS